MQHQQHQRKRKGGGVKNEPTTSATNSSSTTASALSSATAATLNTTDAEEGSFYIIDVDRIAHEILLPPALIDEETCLIQPHHSVYAKVCREFASNEILDEHGCINRLALGRIVFQNHNHARSKLNRITHSQIFFVLFQTLVRQAFWGVKDVVCADIPLLFESGQLRHLFGITICVATTRELQMERLQKRNPELSEQDCLDRIRSQMPLEEKVKLADIVIWNNGDMEQLAEQVERVRRDVMGRIFGVGMSLLQMLLLVGGSLSLAVSSKLFTSWA
jgi:dephospho-CoA kinase